MSHILTLVAGGPKPALETDVLGALAPVFAAYGAEIIDTPRWLSPARALDCPLRFNTQIGFLRAIQKTLESRRIDAFLTPAQNRLKRLILADMDSTIVQGETLDDLAAFAGIKDQIAEITARAMEGQLDFHQAITERVRLLKGLSTQALTQTLKHLKLNPGAATFIRTMKAKGALCVLVSGGFTVFTGPIAAQCGFDQHHGNTLGIDGSHLTGEVIPPILDKNAKVDFLKFYMEKINAQPYHTLTIGDGANDIPMLKAAGLGIAYHPKAAVRTEIDNAIVHGDLTAALYAQGISETDFQN